MDENCSEGLRAQKQRAKTQSQNVQGTSEGEQGEGWA